MLIVMQGAPGSGKSTAARRIAVSINECSILSTDDYFTGPDGVYRYEPERVGAAHGWNQARAETALACGRNVIVDNTNIHAWEARPYVEMAVRWGHAVLFCRCCGDWGSTHGVPAEIVERMRTELEDLTIEKCMGAERPDRPAPAPVANGDCPEPIFGLDFI